MFKLRKKKTDIITSPVNGTVITMDQVKDEVFANKLLGDGFAVEPQDGEIYAPIEGEVFSIFPTKHAISLKSKNGLEVLVHMGIDTVELNGEGFTIHVKEHDQVNASTNMATMDLDAIQAKGKQVPIIVAFTNLKDKEVHVDTGLHQVQDVLTEL